LLAASLIEKMPSTTDGERISDTLLAAEAGRVLAKPEIVDLIEVIDSVLGVMRPLAEQHSVSFKCEHGSDSLPVYGSRAVLRQVLLMALNSMITLPAAGSVKLTSARERRWARLELRIQLRQPDQSPAVREPQHLPELDAVTRLVELAGGTLSPARLDDAGYAYQLRFRLSGEMVLLVVEDNEAVIQAFQRLVRGYDYQVVGVGSGREALQLAGVVQPAAILLDVLMPDLDGWEVLQELKAGPATRHIPVVICSALDDPDLAISLGAQATLVKPVTQGKLLSTLSSVIGVSHDGRAGQGGGRGLANGVDHGA
jgi:CheY-like chemotaxis protein